MRYGSPTYLLALPIYFAVFARALAVAEVQEDWLIDPSPYRAQLLKDEPGQWSLDNGLLRRTFAIEPAAATLALDQLSNGAALLRAVGPEARLTIDGVDYAIGGLIGQPNRAYLDPAWIALLEADQKAWRCTKVDSGPIQERLSWKRVRPAAPDAVWPPRGLALTFHFEPPADATGALEGLSLRLHHELYDGLPLCSKWLELVNDGPHTPKLERCVVELLSLVEGGSYVGGPAELFPRPNLHVDSDFSFGGGMASADALRQVVRWLPDPGYATQVHYERQTPCQLEVGPELGPGVLLAPGQRFESCRSFLLAPDSTERERRGLAVRRMYRTLAPWMTENPLMMHVRNADPETVTAAIEQCAAVGFEMLILSFGSGFDAEDRSPENLLRLKGYADLAHSKGLEIGGYSLLASRSVGPESDVVMPAGQRPVFGNSPCLGSAWGLAYFATLQSLFEQTGLDLLEHDGSYPGDPCASSEHPGHLGLADSQWQQWQQIRAFYGWARARGLYLNVPDWYYLSGSNKCGMGYRETNWSLPRAQQLIHTRQNIYDGTWDKTPSMGWMFVPLTEYQGGGAAATIEPLEQHQEHYEAMLSANLALGVQACYRGPRLFDSERTRAMLSEKVAWFKAHRAILESDVIHGRRADGRDLDWMLHVNPSLEECGLLALWNPTGAEIQRSLDVDLYYTGLSGEARLVGPSGELGTVTLDGRARAQIPVTVPAQGFAWISLKRP